MPRAEDAPRIAARLLTTTIPFAILLSSDLAPRIADANDFPDQPDLQSAYKQAGKIMFLDSDHLWFLGNMPSLSEFCRIFSHVLDRPSPLLSHYAGTLPTPVPTTLDEWRQAQLLEPEFLTLLDPDSLANCSGLHVFKSPDFPSRILVPPSLRDALITQHHHVSRPKVFTSLVRHFFWPSMKADVHRIVDDCATCENEKGKRNLAHGLFSSNTTTKPRSRYAMDCQGQGLTTTGETEALALIDSFIKTVIVIPLKDRQTTTLFPRLMVSDILHSDDDELYFSRGSPDILHSDDVPEFLSDLMNSVADITGTLRTTTWGHNPQSNGEIGSWWRYWNRAMRYLSPSQYLTWSVYAQRIVFAYNSVPHDSIGHISPHKMDFASPLQSPFGPPDPALTFPDLEDPRPTFPRFRRIT
jgi:hypothetical protein